jgi:6-phosphogluconolactonase
MIQQFQNIEQVSSAAVRHIREISRTAIAAKGFCTIVLAGGKTPQLTYEYLGNAPTCKQIFWQQIHFFWGDERWLAASHRDSNFFMANKALLARVSIPPRNIHRIHTGQANPEIGAEMYEKHLRDFFHARDPEAEKRMAGDMLFPSFDLVILGMGTDGHTASLFPGSNLLEEKKKWVAAVPQGVGSPPFARVTLTLPVLNRAENILFLISGSRKREILHTILTRPAEAETMYPAARIKPAGNLFWLVAEKD